MKKHLKSLLFLALISIAFTACKDKAKEAETTNAEAPAAVENTTNAVTYTANTTESNLNWEGFKPTGSHYGTIKLKDGELNVTNGEIVGGKFTIDMNTIVINDIPVDDEGNGKLLAHLKNDDFFDAENHKTSTFEITGLTEAEGKTMLSGNLIIKEISRNITFPVTVKFDTNDVFVTSEKFTIDRTQWDIKYKSKSVFGDLGDKFINDDIELKVFIKATKS
ncbi:YceI family protein [Tamlana sp. I1]|uniref:YceI family protein n=1 Tax=Tamlana sp. I1 TaxID=2762061 RepID=UPI0018905C0C|nr:YceI family protein [Tamlana sp. I1]